MRSCLCLTLAATLVAACATSPESLTSSPATPVQLTVPKATAKPLDEVSVAVSPAPPSGSVVEVRDAQSRLYARLPITSATLHFRASGALGPHTVTALDQTGRLLGSAVVAVDCNTGLEDEHSTGSTQAPFTRLLAALYNTMSRAGNTMMNGKAYHTFVPWIRDHNHVLKAMKYFDPDLLSGVDLYRETQRSDGMIWDNHGRGAALNHWDWRFADQNFVGRFDHDKLQFRRIPVEADVEYLYVEAMWHAWKATGDDEWLKASLPSAERALRYSVSDPLRWSQTLKLVKRGYTIDTWDFQNDEDAKRTGDPMKIDLQNTRFGIMFGDNTGWFHSARLLADMLEHVGRSAEASHWRQEADALQKQLDAVSWNGRFYTHHVPEDPSIQRDLGVNEKEQLSLSNAYSLNRGLSLDKRQTIIAAYQKIRDNLPVGSPGEWYTIYPTFKKGFGSHNDEWQYMNGGVVSIVAGELAHGAFEAGYEAYGADILNRVNALAAKYGGRLPVTLKGSNPPAVAPHFSPLSLKPVANVALTAGALERFGARQKATLWIGDPKNDLPEFPRGKQTFKGIDFDVLRDEDANARVALGLFSPTEAPAKGTKILPTGYASHATVAAHGKSETLYFLHTVSNGNNLAGSVEFRYKDGSRAVAMIKVGSDVVGWWYPELPPAGREPSVQRTVIAWEGKNASALRIGVSLFGLSNPHPERELESLQLNASPTGSKWLVLGLSLSDQPVEFGDSSVSTGIPDNWGAAAVAYALLEGLAGVKDTSTKLQTVALHPRWASTAVQSITTTVKYPASSGYVRYSFARDPKAQTIDLSIAGSGSTAAVSVFLPSGFKVTGVSMGKAPLPYQEPAIGKSRYAQFAVPLNTLGSGVQDVHLQLAPL